MSFFTNVKPAPPDAILGLTTMFKADQSEKKVSLGVGAYRDAQGKPWVLPCVRAAEQQLVDAKLNKEYIPQDGLKTFKDRAVQVLYGKNAKCLSRLATSQSLSGTGGLRLGLEFLKKFYRSDVKVYLSDPTWGNHKGILKEMGLEARSYTYINRKTMGLDLEGMLKDLSEADEGSVVILHLCAHNPTGVDPTQQQWQQIYQVVKKRGLFPFFDNAYQGFASGDPDKDAFAIRYFVEQGSQVMCSQSFAKNFGLYGERIGCLSILCQSPENAEAVRTQLKLIVRRMYSSPPLHGARIVSQVLGSQELTQSWKNDMKLMSARIRKMRTALRDALVQLKTPSPVGGWDHIVNQIGMFSFTGLSTSQVEKLTQDYHIYCLKNGRFSISGINEGNVQYIANAVHSVITDTVSKL